MTSYYPNVIICNIVSLVLLIACGSGFKITYVEREVCFNLWKDMSTTTCFFWCTSGIYLWSSVLSYICQQSPSFHCLLNSIARCWLDKVPKADLLSDCTGLQQDLHVINKSGN